MSHSSWPYLLYNLIQHLFRRDGFAVLFEAAHGYLNGPLFERLFLFNSPDSVLNCS